MKKLFMLLLMLLIITVATYAQMTEQWVSRYNGPRGYDDFPTAMAVDVSGNVIVTGYAIDSTAGTTAFMRYATVKYNSSGEEQWSAIYHIPADTLDVATCNGVDAEGNIYVTGGAGYNHTNWATIKYNSFGVQQWLQIYSGLGIGGNSPRAMKIDAMGNLYITGSGGVVTGQSVDYVTIKYNTNGVQQWIATYNYYIPNGQDQASSIAIDNIGNVYVSGSSYTPASGGSYEIATIKYNSNGGQEWVQRHAGWSSPNGATSIETDDFGNVFVAGGAYVIKYNSSGVMQWDKSGGYATSIALDGSGNLYTSSNIVVPSYQTLIMKYNSAGDSLWGRSFSNYYGSRLTFDNCLGYVYVTTQGFDTINYGAYLTVRYNTYGDSLWSGIYNYQETSSEEPVAITNDGLGNVYLTGTSTDPAHNNTRDFATIKYTPSSFFVHTAKRDNLNKPINDNQSTSDSIFIDCSLMNYSTGDIRLNIDDLMHTKDSDLEIYLIHPATGDNGGDIIDTLVYQVGGTGQNFIGTKLDDSAAISINDGSAPFTGLFRPHRPLSQLNGLSMEGNWILKIYDRASGNEGVLNAWSIDFGLSSQTVGVEEISGEIPGEFNLSQNYPNPFNPSTSIKYTVGNNQFVSLKVYDVLGNEIATLVNEEKPAGNYEVNFDARRLSSGIYFYNLQAGSLVETKKLVLLK